MATTVKEVSFESGGKKLMGSLLAQPDRPGVLFIPGGGNVNRSYWSGWQHFLDARGYNSLSFNFPGIGGSEGAMFDSSLDKRLEDSHAAAALLLKHSSKLYLIGSSMGAPIALRLPATSHLVLLYPAAYAATAWGKKFGPELAAVLRQENSWEESPDFDLASQYPGKIMVVYGDADTVIPAGIQQKYLQLASVPVVLPEAGHRFLHIQDAASWQIQAGLYQRVLDFINH